MGTHPIFESDFDCLTDWNWIMAPSVPEALKKKRQAYQASLAKRALAQQNAKKANTLKRRAIIKRAASYASEYAAQEKLNIAKARLCHPNPRYQPGLSTSQEDLAAPPTPTDWKLHLHQDEQGHHYDAQHCSALHHLGLPQPQDRQGTHLQARSRQGQWPTYPTQGELRRRGKPR